MDAPYAQPDEHGGVGDLPALRHVGARPRARSRSSASTATSDDAGQLPRHPLRRRRARAARLGDVLQLDQRRGHRPVHGRPHPRDERQGAPAVPQPRRQGVPRVGARPVGRELVAAGDRRAARRDRAARPRRSRRRPSRSQYPVQVICGIVGVPLEDHEQFATWAEQINTGPLNPEPGMRGVAGDARLPRAAGRGAPRRADRRPPLASSCTPRSTASGSPTRRSTASSGCCSRPAPRRRSA